MADTGFVYAPQNRPIAEDDPISPFNFYAHSKVAASEVARYHAQHLPVTILRIFSLYSPYENPPRLLPHIVHTAKQGQPIELTAGQQVRDYAYAGDIAQAFWRALSLTPSGQPDIINIGSGTPITLRDFVETVGNILTENGIQPDFRFGARPYRDNELMTYVPNIDKMRNRLGWSFPTSLATGLRTCVEDMLEQTR
jgi:nucleoside-diphosphate-sugar epimerase